MQTAVVRATGMVGRTMMRVLEEKSFPLLNCCLLLLKNLLERGHFSGKTGQGH